MNPVLCQVVPYTTLEEEDELKVEEISSKFTYALCPLNEDVLDDVAFIDGDINHMA